MKALALFLALLVAAKLGYQEYLFRSATREAIVAAYQGQAVVACQKVTLTQGSGVGLQAWESPHAVRLVIGKSGVDVYPWQVDHALWAARYRNPYLLLSAGSRSDPATCEYDIVNAAAHVSRL
jgi:hypothetical protein